MDAMDAMDVNSTTSTGTVPADTSNQQAPIIAAWVVMTVLAGVTVGMRFYTRRLILHILGPEDWLILVAMVLSIGTCVGFVRQTFFALGRHIWTVGPEMMSKWQLEQFYSFLFYTMSLAFTKLSILFLYRRFLVHGLYRIANTVMLVIVTLCNVWVFIDTFISCIPLEAIWDPNVKGTCLGLSVTLGNTILHIVTDFFIFILPIPALVKLKIHKKQKIGLLVVFSLGFFVWLISIIRLAILTRLPASGDTTYHFATVAYWGSVEVNLAILCACLTTLKPLLVRLFPNLLGSTGLASQQYGYMNGSSGRGGTAAAARSGGTVADSRAGTQRPFQKQQRTMAPLGGREFARLDDDESLQSGKGFGDGVYEMEMQGREDGGVRKPARTYIYGS